MSLPESANRVCFCYGQFCQFFPPGFALCVFPPRCVQHPLRPASAQSLTTLCYYCVEFVICAVNFLYFRARYFGVILVFFGGSRSELTLWNTGAEFLPFLQACVLLIYWRILSARNSLTATTQFRIQFLRGFLTAADTSCALKFLNSNLCLCALLVDF